MSTNSVLFDFDSIIDKQISVIKFLRGEYKSFDDEAFYNKDKIFPMSNTYMQFRRMYGNEDLFRSIIMDESLKKSSDTLVELIFDRDQKDIFDKGYAHTTAMISLLSAYSKAGNGTIKATVRCDNQYQVDFIKKMNPDISTLISERSKVDMSGYGRLIAGNYLSTLQYALKSPKSILILNFRENFSDKDTLTIRQELLILSDIHDIGIISAYKEDPNIKG